jgi:hypothetical protein
MLKINLRYGKNCFVLGFNPMNAEGNWSWAMNDSPTTYFKLDCFKSLQLMKSNKTLWSQIIQMLFNTPMRLGREITTANRLEKQIALNYFGWNCPVRLPDETLANLCQKHIGGEEYTTCFNCGAPYNEDEEEEAEAELCDCGYPEEECKCAPCFNCGKSNDECKCILCDVCNLCMCEKKAHQRLHRPCHCETPCDKSERAEKHPITSCKGHDDEHPCDDCNQLECVCEVSESDEFEFY